MDALWIEEHTRGVAPPTCSTALAKRAEACESTTTRSAPWDFLAPAITIDRYQEPLYQRIMLLQSELGGQTPPWRTLPVLEARLADIDAARGVKTARLLHQILPPASSLAPACRIWDP